MKQFIRKYYTTWLIDLANKIYDMEKFLFHFLPRVTKKYLLKNILLKNIVNKYIE